MDELEREIAVRGLSPPPYYYLRREGREREALGIVFGSLEAVESFLLDGEPGLEGFEPAELAGWPEVVRFLESYPVLKYAALEPGAGETAYRLVDIPPVLPLLGDLAARVALERLIERRRRSGTDLTRGG